MKWLDVCSSPSVVELRLMLLIGLARSQGDRLATLALSDDVQTVFFCPKKRRRARNHLQMKDKWLISFDDLQIVTSRRELPKKGEVVPVELQVLDLLAHLETHPGTNLSPGDLIENVWPCRVVRDRATSTRINAPVRRLAMMVKPKDQSKRSRVAASASKARSLTLDRPKASRLRTQGAVTPRRMWFSVRANSKGIAMHLNALTLIIPDYDAAIAYYTGTLGFTLIEDIDQGHKRWVRISPSPSAQTSIILAEPSTPEQRAAIGNQGAGRVWLFLETQDFASDYARLSAQGVHFEEAPRHEPYGTVAVFCDTFGNRWDLIQYG